MRIPKLLFATTVSLTALGAFAACGDDDDDTDAGARDATPFADATPRADAQPTPDSGRADATESDAGAADSATADTGAADSGTLDAGMGDTGGMTGTMFGASLSGAQEVPPVTTAATGTATLTLNGMTLTYRVQHNVSGGTAAHIHLAPAGSNGGVIFPLTPFSMDMTGTLTLTAAQVADLEAGRLYVNVHSGTNPGGEVRGQILRPGERLFVAPLSALQENPPARTSTLTGTNVGSVILNAARDRIHWELSTTARATAAHIHGAPAGQNGGVLIPLTAASRASGDTAISAQHVELLERGTLYMNVHTAAFPGGELRGQLLLPGETLFVARLSGSQEVPVTTSTHTGSGQFVLNHAKTSLRWFVSSSTTTFTASHVHQAPGGVNGGVVFPLGAAPAPMGMRTMTATAVAALERGLWYANIHTARNPGGEIRGQLLRPGETLFTALLSGANEVGPVTTNASGGFALILNASETDVTYDGRLSMITPTAAHVHNAPAGMNGGVVFPLTLDGQGNPSGTQMVTPSQVADLKAGNWYANVHTTANPGGEIRGQLSAKP